jgi:hypothetical protein
MNKVSMIGDRDNFDLMVDGERLHFLVGMIQLINTKLGLGGLG